MTIPRRTDSTSCDPHIATRPKLLAELPHVSEEPAIAPTSSSERNRKSTHPAFAEYVDHEDEPAVEPSRKTKRYVDRSHIDEEWGHEKYERHEMRRNTSQPLIHRQRQSKHRPTPKLALGGLLFEAHQRVAPFAGLIVTAALVAAAGLLFHMMAQGNKSNPEFDEFALPGFQVDAIEESLPPDAPAPLAEVTPTSEPADSQDLNAESAELVPVENATQQVPASKFSVQTAPPLAEANFNPTAPLGQLSFPLTETPLALDYAKATDPDLTVLPEVAERTEAAASEGINR